MSSLCTGKLPIGLENSFKELASDAEKFMAAASQLSEFIAAIEENFSNLEGISRFHKWFPSPDAPPNHRFGLGLERGSKRFILEFARSAPSQTAATWQSLREADVKTKMAAVGIMPEFLEAMRRISVTARIISANDFKYQKRRPLRKRRVHEMAHLNSLPPSPRLCRVVCLLGPAFFPVGMYWMSISQSCAIAALVGICNSYCLYLCLHILTTGQVPRFLFSGSFMRSLINRIPVLNRGIEKAECGIAERGTRR